jgi:hypothetical protein
MATQRAKTQAGGLERPVLGHGEPSSGAVEARDALWLYERSSGVSVVKIARRSRLSCRQVQLGIARARKREQERLQVSDERDSLKRDDAQGCKTGSFSGPREASLGWEDLQRQPRLVPLFPIGPFTPAAVCPHHGPIRSGSVFCCMVCSKSGMDGHPALQRNPRTDPQPEPRVATVVRARAGETRKQRRRRLHEAGQRILATASRATSEADTSAGC